MRQSKTASVLDKSSVNLKLVPFDQRLAQQAELERRRAEEANHSNSDWSSGDQDDGSEDDMFETGLSRDHSRQSWNSSQRSQKEKLERGDKNK
ncbi:hypothetical protein IWQ61_008530 [Dispira simplex]|nr:hypothetical protein IWQ61_008530 [Dispira simplex]